LGTASAEGLAQSVSERYFLRRMDLPVHEGELIAGKYAVERVLGEGGMAFVVSAWHLELGERVALKFLLPEAAQLPEACLRFVREARAAAKIKGEHVARVLDAGTRDDGMPFIVMEYLEGKDLGRLLETDGALSVADAVHYVLQACEAVAQAHAVGIVHRDLKPANLFLTTSPDGSPLVKVLDFGISKCTSVFARTLSPDLTTVNASVGTPGYMSPEQARDAGTVDARTDVWGLGTVLYELLAGRPAFDGDNVPAIVMMIATEEPLTLESLRPDVPVALAAVVRRCMMKSREERFANVAEFARALEPFVPDEARRSVARIARILGHDSVPPPATLDTTPTLRERRPLWLGVMLAGAAATSLIGAFVWSTRSFRWPVASGVSPSPPVESTRPLAAAPVPSPRADAPGAPTNGLAGKALVTSEDEASTPSPAAPASVAPAGDAKTPRSSRSFDATKAATELFAAAGRARDCTRLDAASGGGRATVTFARDGTVSRVSLSAPFAGAANEPCLRAAFASARVRPFDGVARTLEQRFQVVSPHAPGTLTFHANVPASITFDGRSLGPAPQSVSAAPGNHTVVFVHPELGEKAHAVTLAPGQDKTIRATFEPRLD
jgi:serine/threonine-protein kinase